jgi:predicted MFS family arabinose efflux permease
VSAPLRSALRHGPFRRLVVGLAASQVGDWLYNVALLAFVFDRTGSMAWLGATTAARVLPVVVLGPLGGALADRYDRRRLMIAADLARAGLMLALLGAVAAGLPVVVAPVLAALATAAGAPYPACTAASVARLVPAEDLAGANAVRSIVGPVCIVLGPVLGAGVLAIADAQAAFGLNAITFAVSAVAVASIPAGPAFRPAARDAGAAPHLLREMAEGAAALLANRGTLRLVGADILASCVYGLLTVALVLVGDRVGAAAGGYGMLLAATGAGGIVGATVAGRLAGRPHATRTMAIALLAVAAPLPLLGLTSSLVGALGLAALGGAGAMVVEVLTETVLQRDLDDAVLARAYGFAFPVSIGGICAGAALAAPLIGAVGLVPALAIVGAGVAGYAAWLARSATRRTIVPAGPELVAVAARTP